MKQKHKILIRSDVYCIPDKVLALTTFRLIKQELILKVFAVLPSSHCLQGLSRSDKTTVRFQWRIQKIILKWVLAIETLLS